MWMMEVNLLVRVWRCIRRDWARSGASQGALWGSVQWCVARDRAMSCGAGRPGALGTRIALMMWRLAGQGVGIYS
jgi:hypothetical protein